MTPDDYSYTSQEIESFAPKGLASASSLWGCFVAAFKLESFAEQDFQIRIWF
jgi:hypothetical protein